MFELNGHLPDEYGCFHIHTEVAPPEPRIEMLEIPLRDGAINTSALLSDTVHYATREIVLGLESVAVRAEWPLIEAALMRDFHGQAVQLVLDNDPDWYWEGYAAVEQMVDNRGSAGWTIRITAQPFKRKRVEKYMPSITLTGVKSTTTIHIDTARAYPAFTTFSTGIVLEYKGVTYTLPTGKSTVYGLFFTQGDNEIGLTGPGTVAISYREGML